MGLIELPFLLTASRFLLGPAYVVSIAWLASRTGLGSPSSWARLLEAGAGTTPSLVAAATPLIIATLASLSDFVDGRLARRLGTASPTGAALDVAADALFLLLALSALAAAGLVSWLLPVAAVAALSALALRWRRRPPRGDAAPRAFADRIGHWAGIVNYGAVLVASGVPLGWIAPEWLPGASRLVALLNLAPIALHALGRRRRSGREHP